MWRMHSCVPRRHSCRRPVLQGRGGVEKSDGRSLRNVSGGRNQSLVRKVSRESRHGTHECVRYIYFQQLASRFLESLDTGLLTNVAAPAAFWPAERTRKRPRYIATFCS